MQSTVVPGILTENRSLPSAYLGRTVHLDFFLPKNTKDSSPFSLLLINDGQNMQELGLADMLENLYAENVIHPLVCVAIHAGTERKMEYGVASQADYEGRGARADAYTSFILQELLPYISDTCKVQSFREKAFAGFSLGAL